LSFLHQNEIIDHEDPLIYPGVSQEELLLHADASDDTNKGIPVHLQ
jgi:hypothetical protein